MWAGCRPARVAAVLAPFRDLDALCIPRLWPAIDLAPPVLHPRRMARLFRIFAAAAVLWIASAAGSAGAPLRTFYVDPAGNDSAAGSITHPWPTLPKAADTVRAGDLVIARAGPH